MFLNFPADSWLFEHVLVLQQYLVLVQGDSFLPVNEAATAATTAVRRGWSTAHRGGSSAAITTAVLILLSRTFERSNCDEE